jgi:hypothetical protein
MNLREMKKSDDYTIDWAFLPRVSTEGPMPDEPKSVAERSYQMGDVG